LVQQSNPHFEPEAQSALEEHAAYESQEQRPSPQKQSFSVVLVQMHVESWLQANFSSVKHKMSAQPLGHAADWANAGTLRLVRIGADQAIAAPVPTRLSIRRREISFSATPYLLLRLDIERIVLWSGSSLAHER
jgi:hypothetical protein